jgi:hypothetical protein
MKKTYEKPVLVKAPAALSRILARVTGEEP